ncbi:MAG: Coenzyme F420 hydrogenase/dehydrogenase, beta subunit C-terminal domain [Oscillospiraceae bacterium]|nr:Coenzyme F420 hydrogenase/dehydrogenase, beta subunit C-terminal domain [Oscillospiraceae bacterium]
MITKTIEQIDKTDCTGCGLCASKCPTACISMAEDKEGFRFPKIDTAKCVNCGLCFNICPATSAANKLYNKTDRRYFCGIIKDSETLLKSSSGGVFGALASYILSIGGYVCGCVYNDQLEAVHILSNKQEEIEKMYGSKYVQSRAENCFAEIKEHLKAGDTVMFTGTACQIAALRLYIGAESPNLYCVEILCHGVPSPGLFRQYKTYLEKKLKGTVKDIRFRDKRKGGWGCEHRMCVIYEKDGKEAELRPTLPAYFSSFFYGLNFRESCYQCKFATSERVADLTIGDFWGSWSKYGKRFNEGISVVGINSEKGQMLSDSIADSFEFYEVLSESEAIVSNDNFTHPIKRPVERTDFYNGISENGYKGLWKKAYLTKTYKKKTLASIYGAFVPAKIRFFIQKIKKKIAN